MLFCNKIHWETSEKQIQIYNHLYSQTYCNKQYVKLFFYFNFQFQTTFIYLLFSLTRYTIIICDVWSFGSNLLKFVIYQASKNKSVSKQHCLTLYNCTLYDTLWKKLPRKTGSCVFELINYIEWKSHEEVWQQKIKPQHNKAYLIKKMVGSYLKVCWKINVLYPDFWFKKK